MATTRTPKKTTPSQRDAAKKTTPARKTATAKKTTARKPAAKKATPPPLPKRHRDFMTDGQGFATVAARIVGIPTLRINDWRDHNDGTVTRALGDGTLHYTVATRTLRWQATCRMGATHTYRIDDPRMAMDARMRAATCNQPHADLTHLKRLTRDELAELGIHTGPTWAKHLPGEPDTETIPVPLPAKPRVLGDQLTRAHSANADTQPLNQQDIAAGLAARDEQPKEHPQP